MVFPSGSESADSRTPLLASTISPGSRPRCFRSSMWASRSWTATLTNVEPAHWSLSNTCTHPPGTTCHSTTVAIGLLSGARPNNVSYQRRLLSRSLTGTAANTCSIVMFSPSIASRGRPVGRAGVIALQPGVLGGRGEECFQVVAPLRGRGLVRLDAGVVAAIEQQGPRLDLRYFGQRLHRAEHHEVIAAVVHRGHRTVDVGQRTVDDRRTEFRRRPVNPGEFIRFLRAEAGRDVLLALGQHVDAEIPAGLDRLPGPGHLGRAEQHQRRVQ